jgi:hypothetical protein
LTILLLCPLEETEERGDEAAAVFDIQRRADGDLAVEFLSMSQ